MEIALDRASREINRLSPHKESRNGLGDRAALASMARLSARFVLADDGIADSVGYGAACQDQSSASFSRFQRMVFVVQMQKEILHGAGKLSRSASACC